MAESETECAAPGLNTLEPECVTSHSGVSDVHHTHTSLIKTETDLGYTHTGDLIKTECFDFTEVEYMTRLHPDQIKKENDDVEYFKAEHTGDFLENKCAAPGLNTLESECVTAHSGVSDVHHTHTSLIKTETDLGCTHTGNLIKTESLDFTELEYLSRLHNNQIKTEAYDGGFLKVEHIRDSQDLKAVDIKCGQLKCESSIRSENDLMDTVMTGAAVGHKDQTESWQCAGEPHPHCKKEETHELLTSCGDSTHHCDKNNGSIQSTIVLKSRNSCRVHLQRMNDMVEPMIMKSSKNQRSFKSNQNKTLLRDKNEIHTALKTYNCIQCEKSFKTETDLDSTCNGHLIKPENLDFTEVEYMTRLLTDKIKKENDDVEYFKAEHTGDFLEHKCINIKTELKCESSENTVTDLMSTSVSETAADRKDQIKPEQCVGDPEPNCKKEVNDVLIKSEDVNHHCEITTASSHNTIVQKITNNTNKPDHMINNSHKKQRLMDILPKNTNSRDSGATNTDKKRYKCSQCGKCYTTKSSLNIHLRIHTGEKPFKCSQCGKCFIANTNLNKHLIMHTGEKPYECSQCGKCFNTKSILQTHQKIHTGEKPYKCAQCGKCFAVLSWLNEHQIIHTDEKPWKCTQCGKCFKSKSHLSRHLRIHKVEKPHKCSQCGKGFDNKCCLVRHKRLHTGEKPYECSECGKCFTCKPSLNSHLINHSGEKPYTCSLCGKSFSFKKALKAHQIIHTGEKPFKCSHCGKCFGYKSNLSKHQRSHSGEN